jgi:hypothetical protein
MKRTWCGKSTDGLRPARVTEWRSLLRKETLWSRQIITKLLNGKITLMPTLDESGKPAYEMLKNSLSGGFCSGIFCPAGGTSPTGVEKGRRVMCLPMERPQKEWPR